MRIRNFAKNNLDVINSSLNQIFRIISGPLVLILIPLYTDETSQGFWYTFISISALTVFVDLGFTNIINQFSAHEYAFLNFNNNKIQGDKISLQRLSSLFKFILKWTIIVTVITFPIIWGIGYNLFKNEDQIITWNYPWLIYLIGAGIIFLNTTIASFLQGCDQVPKIQKIQFISSIVYVITIVILLINNFGLFSLAYATLIKGIIQFILYFKLYFTFFSELFKVKVEILLDWPKEIIPLLGKYAVSWISGYFLFKLYTPLTFKYYGAVDAGKVGLSISLLTAIFTISNVWITSKKPKINFLIAKKKWIQLDKMFKNLMIKTTLSYLVVSFCAFISLYLLKNISAFENIFTRILGPISMVILFISWLLQLVLNGMAVYLRSHKIEPYMYISLFAALYNIITTFLILKYLNINYIFFGYLTSFAIIGYPAIKIFKRTKAKLHY